MNILIIDSNTVEPLFYIDFPFKAMNLQVNLLTDTTLWPSG